MGSGLRENQNWSTEAKLEISRVPTADSEWYQTFQSISVSTVQCSDLECTLYYKDLKMTIN